MPAAIFAASMRVKSAIKTTNVARPQGPLHVGFVMSREHTCSSLAYASRPVRNDLPIFEPPTVEEGIDATGLCRYFRTARGITVLVNGSTVTQTRYPAQDELDGYDHVYLGGYLYQITDDEAAVLAAAGYGDHIHD
jgi:hypothetical protein